MRVSIGATITVENPSQALNDWCEEHLVIPNPEYAKKVRMHFWVGNTPKTLSLYERRGNALILPFGILRDVQHFLWGHPCTSEFPEPVEIAYGGEVPLYSYQDDAVNVVKECRYGILQSPAGSGKTQMGIALVMRYGRRALWLTHTADLLNQSKARAERYMDKRLIGTITEGKVNIGQGITFATIQTMCRLDLAQYKDLWDVIIVDECHRVAGTPTAMTQFFKVLNSLSARHKYGLSATVHRADGMIPATYALLGHVVHTVPDEAVKDKIMQVGIKPLGTGVKLSRECLNTDGTINYTKLISYLCENEERTHYIGSWIVAEADHPCLILSDRLNHLEALMNTLPRSMREMSVMISGKMTTKKGKAEREQAIEDMRTGRKRYLFATYSLAKEGLDIPCLERLFLTTPQKDYAVITQSIGRIARTHEGKKPPIAYDFVDDIGFLVKSYKKRCSTYRKNGCYFEEDA
ncbi:MAG: DEAD/DEAH box helicase family protein [Clostridia bacterium]|nr:DEAD/DEAH box helicase family protein [Clostridia bacterium]